MIKINKKKTAVHLPITDRPTGKNPGIPDGQSTHGKAVPLSGCACVCVQYARACACVKGGVGGTKKTICNVITMMLHYWLDLLHDMYLSV